MSYMSDTFTDKQNPDNTITLSGHGQVASVPDLAVIRLGVLTSGLNLTDIQSENAEIIGIILRELRQLGINDIKTFQYSIGVNIIISRLLIWPLIMPFKKPDQSQQT